MKKQLKHWLIPCASAAFAMGMSMVSFAAGWSPEGSTWVYHDSNGNRITQEWRKSGDSWFYLNEYGEMAKSQLIEDNGEYYYVNSLGARVTNEWREIPNEDDYEEDAPATNWYYLGSNGKAYKAGNNGNTTFRTITKANGDVKKYAFDEQGKMLFGWVDENGQRQVGEDAWRTGIYYCGEASDGARAENEWKKLDVVDDDNQDADFDEAYWFYFDSTGKKAADREKTINKGRYLFDENGVAKYSWNEMNIGTPSDAYYNLPDQCWRADGWFKAVPSEEMNPDANSEGEEYWYYFSQSGKDLIRSQIRSINNYSYAFNERGEMLQGLYKMKVDGKEIKEYQKVEAIYELPEKEEDWKVYYFGNTPKEGSMATGNTTVNLEGEKFSFGFYKSGSKRGAGVEGIYEDSIYVKGLLQKADRDLRYQVVEHEDNPYLINTTGRIQKNKKNVRDGDGTYYSTDKNGIVTYQGSDKQ